MPKKALMINYEYCSGCHSCEVACKQEHNYPVGKGGIHLNEIMTTLPDGRLRIDYIPFPTAYCDLCASRVKKGEQPACVKHCQAQVMEYGLVTDLAKKMDKKSHYVMFTPK
jgi:anaerobic dimethyl sulfoxide reductase subunit B (iron-sulfur subunit)